MEQKYKFLHTAATIFKVLAWVALVLGIIGSIAAAASTGIMPRGVGFGILTAVLGIVYSVVSWVALLAIAELLHLFMDLEQNTRETAERLKSGHPGT